MHQNPFEPTITDEDSGITISNPDAAIWEQGYMAAINDVKRLVNLAGSICTGALEDIQNNRFRELREASGANREG